MGIHVGDLLALADALLRQGDECARRSAISRAYYASYHQALLWEQAVRGEGGRGASRGGVHQQLLHRLRHPGNELAPDVRLKSRLLAARLDAQRRRRTLADYRLGASMPASEARHQVELARLLVEEHDHAPARAHHPPFS